MSAFVRVFFFFPSPPRADLPTGVHTLLSKREGFPFPSLGVSPATATYGIFFRPPWRVFPVPSGARSANFLPCFASSPSDARCAPVVTGGHATHADSAGDHAHPTAACPRPSPAAERSRNGERARRGGVEATTEACRDGRLCHRWHGWVFPLLGWDCIVLCVGGGVGGAGGWWMNAMFSSSMRGRWIG